MGEWNRMAYIKKALQDYWVFVIVSVFLFLSSGEVSVLKVLFLFCIQIILIFVPGEVFLKSTKIIFKDGAIAHLCAYAAGYVMSIVVYIVLLMIGIQKYCFPICLIYGAVMLFFYYKKRLLINYKSHIQNVDNTILVSCLTIALIIGVTVYLLPNRSPQIIGYQNQTGDLTYWFKNCVAATKGYPLPELSVKGLYLYWHLFSCFEVAFLHFMTGIEIYNLCFTFSYIWKILLLVGSVYVLASYFLENKSHILIVMLVSLFTSGIDKQTLVYYQYHLFRCSLAFEEGYAMSMFGFVFFLKFMDMEKKNLFAYMLTVLGMAGALGLKASGGTILLAGIAGKLLFSLKKDWKKIFKTGLLFMSYCLIYLVISKLFIIDRSALSSSTSSHQMIFSPFDTFMRSGYYGPVYQTLKTGFLNKYAAYIITIFIYFLQIDYAISVPLIICTVLILVSGKWRCLFSKTIFPLIVMILCGLGIFIMFNHSGFSQVYFVFNTFSFAALLAILFLERCESDFRYAERTVMIAASVLTILSCHYNFVNYTDIYLLPSSAFHTQVFAQSTGENDISSLEVEGLRWIRENLPEEVVLATNKVLWNHPEETEFSRTFITSEFAERQVYLEGFSSTNLPNMEFVSDRLAQVRDYYNGVPGAATVLRHRGGVTHAVVFRNGLDPSVTLAGKVIYENDDMMVLDIRETD